MMKKGTMTLLAVATLGSLACASDAPPPLSTSETHDDSREGPLSSFGVRLDSESSDPVLFQVAEDDDGIRVQTGPAGIVYREADAVLSAGNTGGMVAAASLKLRTLPGVDRPGIATVMPTKTSNFVLLDAGANVEGKPRHLMHYAIMGDIYAREVLGKSRPRVGLLSVGTEEAKGNDLTVETFKLCSALDLNFIGNVEGHDLFREELDVVVCNGFVGNIVLKTCESLALHMMGWLRDELTATPIRRLGAALSKNAFRALKNRIDTENYGGAPLLGVNGIVTISHGSSSARAICNAVQHTVEAVDHHINEHIIDAVSKANAKMANSKPEPTAAQA